MSSTTTPENPEIRDLINRALKLSTEEREAIALELLESTEAAPAAQPGNPDYWKAEILRRSAEIASGSVTPLTREEAESQVRATIRKLGVEL
jgi:putative addiction module component (TIGR02574 family)